MEDKIKALIKAIEDKTNPEFNFEAEHWDWGNFDDSFSYGYECGEEQTLRDILKGLKDLMIQE